MEFKNFLTLSEQYLISANTLIEKIIENNNSYTTISNKKQKIQTKKYNDSHILVPALWSSYHGIELLLKGLLLIKSNSLKFNHNSKKHIDDFKLLFPNRKKIIELLDNFINNSFTILNQYIKDNNLNSCEISKIYESLRYPYNHTNYCYNYDSLKYNSFSIIDKLQEIININNNLLKEGIKIYHYYDKQKN